MRETRGMCGRPAAMLAIGLALALLAVAMGGCAGAGFTADEVRRLEQATADARFVDSSWDELGAEERREFVRHNALRWTFFNDLVHGRPPSVEPGGGAPDDAEVTDE